MAKRKPKRKPNKKLAPNSQTKSARLISKVEELFKADQYEEGMFLLQQHLDRFPNDTEVLEFWFGLAVEDDVPLIMWDIARRLYKLDSTNVKYVVDLLLACMQIPMPFTALKLINLHSQLLNEHSDFEFEISVDDPSLSAARENLMAQFQTTEGMTEDHLVQFETLQNLYELQFEDEAQTVAEGLLQDFPDSVTLLNLMTDGNMLLGKYAQASQYAQKVLEFDPNNLTALCNFITNQFKLGQLGEVNNHVERLRAITTFEDDHEVMTAMETWAWLEDDERIVNIFEKHHKKLPNLDQNAAVLHLVATSYAFLGNEKEAKKWWRRSYKLNPDMDIVDANLEDLSRPVGERNGPFHFHPSGWIPTAWASIIMDALMARNEKQVVRQLQKFYQDTPALQFILPIVFRRGSETIVQFLIEMATLMELPILADFALGRHGKDQLRMQAANMAAEFGFLPHGQMTDLYINGERKPILLFSHDIHTEPSKDKPPRVIRSLVDDAYQLLYKGHFDSALKLVEEGLEKVPDYPPLLNYLAIIYRAKQQPAEEEAIIRRTYDVHPDYFFGRCGMVELYAREGNFEAAEAILNPLLEMKRLHISEYGMLCRSYALFLTAKGQYVGAHSWLNMWEDVMPNLKEIQDIRRQIKKAERTASRSK